MSDSEHHKSPVETLLDKLGVALATALAGTIVFLLAYLGRPIVDAIAAASTKEFLLRLVALLGFALLLGGAYILHLRSQIRKPLSSKFDFDKVSGCYIDRKTGHGVCTHCLAEGVVIHLMDIAGPDQPRMCNACHTVFRGHPQRVKSL
jgi:hypothetical protein